MSVNTDKAKSRPLGVAEALVKHSIDKAAAYSKVVVLTGEREVLLTANGRWCFLDALALLSRVVGTLIVVLPEGTTELEAEARSYCARAWSLGSLTVIPDNGTIPLKSVNAILNIGTKVMPSLPWTAVNSNGWVARVSSGNETLPGDVGQANPVAALMAASLGVAEVFKRVFDVPNDVAPLLQKTELSLFEQTTSPTSIGPLLPDKIRIPDALLIGAGAIGNGIALLFSQLPLCGRVHVIDKQDYADENLGTCILVEPTGWLGHSKAERLASWLQQNSELRVTGEKALIESAKSGPIIAGLAVDLVLNGLDDVEARHAAQDLWPAVIIDGGINEVGAAVTQYRLDHEDQACLKCWFEPPKLDERALQSRLTGLATTSLNDMNRLLTDDDIEQSSEHKRDWLQEQRKKGKALCSIISEATLASRFGVDVEEGFRPSAPFVATAAAAMVLAEAVKSLEFPLDRVASVFHIGNLFLGPEESAIKLNRSPSSGCQCLVHRKNILILAKLRTERSRASRTEST